MKKRLITLIALMVAIVWVCTGCSSAVKEKDIKEDLENYTKERLLDDGQKIDKVEIDKRNTDKQQKLDEIWCTVTVKDSNLEYQKHYILIYLLYDQGGWNLDEVDSDESKKDTVIPVKGVTKKNVKESLEGKTVKTEEGKWNIESGEIKSLEIQSQKTDLKKKTDNLTVQITLDSEIETASGEIKIKYAFDDEWGLKTVKEQEKLKVSSKKDKALNKSEDDLISDLEKEDIYYAVNQDERSDDDEGSIMTDPIQYNIKKDEISNFKIVSDKRRNKGKDVIYKCSFDMKKTMMSCNMEAELEYIYATEEDEEGWYLNSISTKIKQDSLTCDLQGEWKGTYEGVGLELGNAELNITSVDGNNITGVYSYTPDTVNDSIGLHSGSYNVSGTLDQEYLYLNLTAGDWVNQPNNVDPFEKQDIKAEFNFEDGTIVGRGQDNVLFTVKK